MDRVFPESGVGASRINSDLVAFPEIGGKKRSMKVPAARRNREPAPNCRPNGNIRRQTGDRAPLESRTRETVEW
jgi:hypothetical protein